MCMHYVCMHIHGYSFIHRAVAIDGNILHHASSCNEHHEENLTPSSNLMLAAIHIISFQLFPGLTLIISTSHLSAYS